jgi:hypothetical protein
MTAATKRTATVIVLMLALLLLLSRVVPELVANGLEDGSANDPSQDELTTRTLRQLGVFTDWLYRHDERGFIGEVGWPDDQMGDAELWNELAEHWYGVADRDGLWVSAWASGPMWDDYPLEVYERTSRRLEEGTYVAYRPNTQAEVIERHLGTTAYQRGIATAGGSFGDTAPSFSNANPGEYGVHYRYPGQRLFQYLAKRGYDFARLDFRWERIQPEPYGPLDDRELERMRLAVSEAEEAGLGVILDLHNYGEYMHAGPNGPRRLTVGSDELPTSTFVDLWERLSDAFADEDGVLAYGLMNEPHDLAPRNEPPRVLYDWEADTQGWVGPVSHETSTAQSGTGSLAIEWTGESDALFVDDGDGARKDCAAGGSTFSVSVYLPEDAPTGDWSASLQVQDAFYDYSAGPHTTLVPGEWTQVRHDPPTTVLGYCRALGLHLVGPPNARSRLWIDDLAQSGSLSGAQAWEAASQAVVASLRERGDESTLAIAGHGWSKVQTWQEQHPLPWIKDPLDDSIYEAHHYWDDDHDSIYDSYRQESMVDAVMPAIRTSLDGTGSSLP